MLWIKQHLSGTTDTNVNKQTVFATTGFQSSWMDQSVST